MKPGVLTYKKSSLGWMVGLALLLYTGGAIDAANADQIPGNPVRLSTADLSPEEHTIWITDNWKFKPGDNLDWADPGINDQDWQQVSTYLGPSELPFLEWEGIGWFRLHLSVDSTLVDYPLALLLEQHNGASEIYLNGELLYRLGDVSIFEDDFMPYHDSRPRPITFRNTYEHVLAVRYSNHEASRYNKMGFTSGFRIILGDLNYHIQNRIDQLGAIPMKQMFYLGGLLAFTVIHFLLFVFYPSEKRNLFFALFTGFLALLTYTHLETFFSESPLVTISYYRFYLIILLLTVIYALRFTYSLFYQKPPVQFWPFLLVGLGLAVATWFYAEGLSFYRELFVLLIIIEILRVLTISFFLQKEGVWIIGTGLIGFLGGVGFTVLANLELVSGNPVLGNLYGSVVLIFTMSIYLSRDFARTQKRLEHKLLEVKHLSKRSLEQERINKQKELERRLLEAENKRKTKELEEARALQLSMLPKQIPQTDHWDIAVYMETAQEVGGDYYDFSVSKDGILTVALGDATGHGMKAGIMVATAKSYFHTLVDQHDNLSIIRRMSSGIRNMDLHLMYMGFSLMKCNERSINISIAGMPPILHYRHASQAVDKIVLKGLPLGSRVEYPYQEKTVQVDKDDVFVMMSDGLMELFNEERKLLGMERIERVLRETGESSASDILSQLTKLADQWSGSKSHEDDITVLVLKAKHQL